MPDYYESIAEEPTGETGAESMHGGTRELFSCELTGSNCFVV
jgi:hypothetical protein